MKTLILDNYDSFTYNLYQYVAELDGDPVVVRNDELLMKEAKETQEAEEAKESIADIQPTHIIISPGPGNPDTPRDIGVSRELIDYAIEKNIPLLGVCLGHQILGVHFGSTVERAPEIFHGKESEILFDEPRSVLFADLPAVASVMRYHSLHVTQIPENFRETARTPEGMIMAMEHESQQIFGVQFHPESIGTPEGMRMLRNFLLIRST